MTPSRELQLLAKKHRWAFRELTLDQHMIEANQMQGRMKVCFHYLKSRYGTAVDTVTSLLQMANALRNQVPAGTTQEKLNYLTRNYPWVLEELVREEKEREAVEKFSQLDKMWNYLTVIFGSRVEALENIKWLVQHQQKPRKTASYSPKALCSVNGS